MDIHEQEKLRMLIQELAQLIRAILLHSPELRSTLQIIEEKGYQVELVLASMTRIQKKDEPSLSDSNREEPPKSDQEFLRNLRIRWDGLPNF
jgi:hypothetical protein